MGDKGNLIIKARTLDGFLRLHLLLSIPDTDVRLERTEQINEARNDKLI